jgi:hypothetical protein
LATGGCRTGSIIAFEKEKKDPRFLAAPKEELGQPVYNLKAKNSCLKKQSYPPE